MEAVEGRLMDRALRDPYHHPGRHLLQHEEEGRLADREDAPARLDGVCDARRHGPEREGRDHARVPQRLLQGFDYH